MAASTPIFEPAIWRRDPSGMLRLFAFESSADTYTLTCGLTDDREIVIVAAHNPAGQQPTVNGSERYRGRDPELAWRAIQEFVVWISHVGFDWTNGTIPASIDRFLEAVRDSAQRETLSREVAELLAAGPLTV